MLTCRFRAPAGLTLALLMATPLAAQQPETVTAGPAASPAVELRVTDLTPRFLTFYERAVAENADADRRWELWREHYGFAALPPVPERDSIARALLDDAWPRYPEVIERIRGGVAAMQPAPEPLLASVAALLGAEVGLRLDLLVYVGALERNAFFAPQQGTLFVAVPIEESPEWRTRVLVHEFTHAVHHRLANFSEGWERSIARTVFAEGLATRATQTLLPGDRPESYVEHRDGWFAEAERRAPQILSGIVPFLEESSSEQVMRFTMGTGVTGLEREAYYVGWVVVGQLLDEGYTFERLARIPEDDIPALVRRTIKILTRET
jgi:hypothetical protein